MSQGFELPEGYRLRYKYYRPPADGGGGLPLTRGGKDPSGKLAVQAWLGRWAGYDQYQKGLSGWRPGSHGGLVICTIYNNDGVGVCCGKATCHTEDVFCYRIGRDIAKGRALKKLAERKYSVSLG